MSTKRNTYLVIETENTLGRVAYVETVSASDNLLKFAKSDNKIRSISAYSTKKDATNQAQKLNELYKGGN